MAQGGNHQPVADRIIVYSQNEGNGIGEFTAYDLRTGEMVLPIRFQRGADWYGGWNRVEYSPDGRRLSIKPLADIEIWDLASGAELFTLAGHYGDVEAVAIAPDGRLAASAGRDGEVDDSVPELGFQPRGLGIDDGESSTRFAADVCGEDVSIRNSQPA